MVDFEQVNASYDSTFALNFEPAFKGNIFLFSFSEKLEKSLQEITSLKENLKEKSEREEKLEGLYFVSSF